MLPGAQEKLHQGAQADLQEAMQGHPQGGVQAGPNQGAVPGAQGKLQECPQERVSPGSGAEAQGGETHVARCTKGKEGEGPVVLEIGPGWDVARKEGF